MNHKEWSARGGKARAKNLTKKERSESASIAATKRWEQARLIAAAPALLAALRVFVEYANEQVAELPADKASFSWLLHDLAAARLYQGEIAIAQAEGRPMRVPGEITISSSVHEGRGEKQATGRALTVHKKKDQVKT